MSTAELIDWDERMPEFKNARRDPGLPPSVRTAVSSLVRAMDGWTPPSSNYGELEKLYGKAERLDTAACLALRSFRAGGVSERRLLEVIGRCIRFYSEAV